MFCSFDAKNIWKYIFQASIGVNFSKFIKVVPAHGTCFQTTCTIFVDHFKIFDLNPAMLCFTIFPLIIALSLYLILKL